jgi:hypothetical protein
MFHVSQRHANGVVGGEVLLVHQVQEVSGLQGVNAFGKRVKPCPAGTILIFNSERGNNVEKI